MDASILTRKYQVADPSSFSLQPDPPEMQPQEAPMNHPTAFLVGAQEGAAPFMPHEPRTVVPPDVLPEGVPRGGAQPAQAPPAAAPAPQSPAQTLARRPTPEGEQKIPKGWTKERMEEADELNRMGRAYADKVESRRAKRKAVSGYEKMKAQRDAAAAAVQDLKELKKSYDKDDPHAMEIQRRIMTNLIKGERLQEEMRKTSQNLNKTHKLPLDKSGFLSDYDGQLDEDDKAFDNEALESMSQAFERSPSQ